MQSGVINYVTNQITLTGTNFVPGKVKPAILFNGAALTVTSFSNTQIIATLPSGIAPGTFNLTLTNSAGNSVEFDMSYGAIGPQGPAGAAGPAGAQGPAGLTGPCRSAAGPRGLTGAPGAPGPAGANGTAFIFLNAFDPYATYAVNNVVTYNGSSYVAIVPNGPNPTGPTPDKNPSWSLMAAAGATGPTGPAGPQGPLGDPGPQGLMGNPGSARTGWDLRDHKDQPAGYCPGLQTSKASRSPCASRPTLSEHGQFQRPGQRWYLYSRRLAIIRE